MNLNGFKTQKLSAVLLSLAVSSSAMAEAPILIVGASYGNAVTPFNDAVNAPLGGTSVNLGSYLSLGNALVRNRSLSGHVINEAQAGATTFDRIFCFTDCYPSITWQGYETQLTKAVARVASTNPDTGEVSYNADYVVIINGNDCLHPGAFEVPIQDTTPCKLQDFEDHADRMVSLGQKALDYGITPIFIDFPAYDDMDLPLFAESIGFSWVIDKTSYDTMATINRERIGAELPDAVVLDAWKHFTHNGDGIHQDDKTSAKAAQRIANYILTHEAQ